jgi:hypothetical protein
MATRKTQGPMKPRTDIPILPGKSQDEFFYPDTRTLTLPWIYFFEKLAKLQDTQGGTAAAAGTPEPRVVILEDTNTGAKAIPLVQERAVLLDKAVMIIGPDSGNTAALTVDVFLDGASIFGATKLVMPAGSAVDTVVEQPVFASDPMSAAIGQRWDATIVSGDGSTMASVMIVTRTA